MKGDIFQDYKSIHISLDKATYRAFQIYLIKHNDLRMAEVFEEFARLVINGDNKATKIIDNLVIKKIESYTNSKLRFPIRRKTPLVSEEKNILYDMIEKHQVEPILSSDKEKDDKGKK